ncbi:MAG: hypothetical protein P4L46_22795 [Fimbriimonas sp.]|nr:hypothetical protein [Fimbriimonas sp.]
MAKVIIRNVVTWSDVKLSMAGRLYNEKEVSEILRRASSSRLGGDPSDSGGISLGELKEIGAELGLDPEQISLAAQEMKSDSAARSGPFGARIVLDRTMDGEVSTDDWLGMVAVMQRFHKDSGAVTQRGMNYDWAGSEEGASLALTVKSSKGRSRIRLESNRWMGVVMASVFCSVFALVFSVTLAKHGHAIASPLVVLAFGALYFGFIRFFRKSHAESVCDLMDRLADEVQSEVAVHPLVNAAQVAGETATRGQTLQA